MSRLLITGATGFVGRGLIQRLLANEELVPIAAVRRADASLPAGVTPVVVGEIGPDTDWSEALVGIDLVVHAAGRAHLLNRESDTSLQAFRDVNTAGTLVFARQAAAAGVRRFVFVSSIGVIGDHGDRPFNEHDDPHPLNPYAISKLEAEVGLHELARTSSMEIVIIRPPLVYGLNASGNFQRLKKLVIGGLPLPLGALKNTRSFIALDNLVDFIVTCLDHPSATNQVFHVCDATDLSTPDLIRMMGEGLGKPARLVAFPVRLLYWMAVIAGKKREFMSLCGSLQIDSSKAYRLLGWQPPISTERAIREAVKATFS